MLVVGGTYFERCRFPHSRELYGPGLRGICSISNLAESPDNLATFLAAREQQSVEVYAATHGFEFEARSIDETLEFDYLHNHSNPNHPPKDKIDYRTIGPLEEEAVLRYGMLEGTAVVQGERVVYDPQSDEPDQFYENGSEAGELALVLNKKEGESMTGARTREGILDKLIDGQHSADVAVLKCGASGSVVRADGDTYEIPVFRTPKVWGIGSGDVFSAVFASFWAEQRLSAQEAARKASLATAYYCQTRTLPVPAEPNEVNGFNPDELILDFEEEAPTIYLAGPFFNIGQFFLLEEVQKILEWEGVAVFSPFHDVGRVGNRNDTEEVARRDLKGIEESDALLALLDGNDPGTYFEIGFARDQDIPVVAYQHEPNRNRHTMLEGTGCEIHGDLSSAIFRAIWKCYD